MVLDIISDNSIKTIADLKEAFQDSYDTDHYSMPVQYMMIINRSNLLLNFHQLMMVSFFKIRL